ncbi:Uncharacterized protein PBTT_08761 [Plasmodiophora brassicae]
MDISDVSRAEALLQQVRARVVARQAGPGDVSALDEVLGLLHDALILRRAAHQEADMQQATSALDDLAAGGAAVAPAANPDPAQPATQEKPAQ